MEDSTTIKLSIHQIYRDVSNIPDYIKPYVKEGELEVTMDEINERSCIGLSLVHHAASAGDVEVLKLLLDHGGFINQKTSPSRESGAIAKTPLSLVLEKIEQCETIAGKNKFNQVRELLIDYGADRTAIGEALVKSKKRAEEDTWRKQQEKKCKLQNKKADNERRVRECADGDEQLEKIYYDFYCYLQGKLGNIIMSNRIKSTDTQTVDLQKFANHKITDIALKSLPMEVSAIISITSLLFKAYKVLVNPQQVEVFKDQVSHIINNQNTDQIISDYAARITEFYIEDIITPDADVGHSLKRKKEKPDIKPSLISDFVGVPRSEIASYYQKQGEDFILPHWDELVKGSIAKFLKYLSTHRANFQEELGIKIAENFLPQWHKEKMIFPPKGEMFQIDIARNLAQIAELSYKSKLQFTNIAKKWGFNIANFRQSDLFKSVVMHDDENLIVAFRGTYHNWNWSSNFNILTKDINIRDEQITVHRGFYEALSTHWFRGERQNTKNQNTNLEIPLEKTVKELLTQKPYLNIYVTGHSLGASMSANAYMQLLNMEINGQLLNIDQISLYNYGQPLWCRASSAKLAEKYFNNNYYRIANYHDLVPTVPPEEVGFKHLGKLCYLHKDGTIIDQEEYNNIIANKSIEKKISTNLLSGLSAREYFLENHGMLHYTKKLYAGKVKFTAKKQDHSSKTRSEIEPQESQLGFDPFSKEALEHLREKLPKLDQERKEENSKESKKLETKQENLELVDNKPKITTKTLDEDDTKLSDKELDVLYGELADGKKYTYKKCKKFLDQKMAKLQFNEGEFSDKDSWTLLHQAAWQGDIEKLRSLYENNSELINITDRLIEYNVTHLASIAGHVRIVKFLLAAESQLISFKNRWGESVLHSAAYSGNLEVVKLLLETAPQLINAKDSDGWSVLHVAAYSGNWEVVEFFLERAPQLINAKRNDGWSVLHAAAYSGNLEVVKLLLDREPQLINAKRNDGLSV
ncbi:MAG: hypothetical protein DGJ47_001139, partial [Rickettsiaceae bacterium]